MVHPGHGYRPGYVSTADGWLHYVEAGQGDPVLFIHQTPRSWDEFREVLPLVAPHYRAIAMDLPGMGASSSLRGIATIEGYAAAAIRLLDGLDIPQADLFGHHTGGVVALHVAATRPGRVSRLVLSSTPWVDATARRRRGERPTVDEVEVTEGGEHLLALWRGRSKFYPPGRPDLLSRFVADALRADRPHSGHEAVARYEMERSIGSVRHRTLCIGNSDDPHAFSDLDQVASRLQAAKIAVIEGGTVPLEFRASAVAEAVLAFLGMD